MYELPTMDLSAPETGCCPRFDSEKWHNKTFQFDRLLFAKAYSKSIAHIPLNMDKVMKHSIKSITDADAQPKERYLMLSHDLSAWKSEHHFLVTKKVDDMEMEEMSGTFYARVYNGEFKEIPTWIHDMEKNLLEKGKEAKVIYSFYTTCPKCAKYYKENYVVLFAQI